MKLASKSYLAFLCRHHFALATNPGEQFYSFTSIAAWLLQMCGKHFEQPQEVSDCDRNLKCDAMLVAVLLLL